MVFLKKNSNLFSIYDNKSRAFQAPFVHSNESTALRALADTVFELNCLACSLKALAVSLRATGSAIAPLCRAAFAP